ncbi:ribokinase [Mycoplasmatota bacterium]|nr:ribokinase [Mycoplasmatota bacterium]
MNIVVVGSINTDLITISDKFPKIGETITGNDFTTLPGGKGANQAVGAAKLGTEVLFVGCVGNDSNGELSLNNFKNENVNTDYVKKIDGVPSGIAQITVAEGDNSIIVVSGANNEVTKELVKNNLSAFDNAKIVLLQLEIPLETVEYVTEVCNERGIKVILNPAPAVDLDLELIEKVDYLTPNEIELEMIFNDSMENVLKQYPNKVIMTSGDKGVYYHNGDSIVNVPGFKVDVVDTTGAGDSFNGALAYGLFNNFNLKKAIEIANLVASKTVQKIGAQTAMPYLEDLELER